MMPARALTWISRLAAAAVACNCIHCAKAPDSARQGAVPVTSFAAAVHAQGRTPLELALVSGKATYDRYCAICHGDAGGGDGFNAYPVKDAFGVSPTAFTDPAQMASLKDANSLAAIRDGGLAVGKSAAMPGWGYTLTPGEVADVWQYVRSLAAANHQP